MNARSQNLGYSLPIFGGDLPVCRFMWVERHQDTKTPFVSEEIATE